MEKLLKSVQAKSIAIASGKGGVGKTMTSTNFAIYLALKGFRVGLIDVDPLSDVVTLLDLQDRDLNLPPLNRITCFKDCRIPVIPRMDLIFPQAKTSGVSILSLMNRLYDEFLEQLDKYYDYLIFDMPAGVQEKENLIFLDKMNLILLVTNPEPTAHVSAGGFIKKALEHHGETRFLIWHNKYAQAVETDFRAADLLGNYNRNVPEEDRLEEVNLKDVAFIPSDPTLDLLKSDPSVKFNILRNIQENLKVMLELTLPMISQTKELDTRSFRIIRYYIKNHPQINNKEKYLGELEEYLCGLLGNSLQKGNFFSAKQKDEVMAYLDKVTKIPLRKELVRAWLIVDKKTKEFEMAQGLFSSQKVSEVFHYVDRGVVEFLMTCSKIVHKMPLIRNMSSLLLFNFTLLKLFQSDTVNAIIQEFIPTRQNARGQRVRDRHRQILNLVRNDNLYRKRYLELLKMLRPLVEKQLVAIVNTFGLKSLLFLDDNRKVNRGAYVKLFSNFLHETIYSGLGVTVGFRFRPASQSFRRGADLVIREMGLPA
ncbi:MAG: P-loop NTPase [Spirochaetaceae bacterium]|jgi:MinD-like ATPase involved in chromosome partitioning or flagellar assembly|nr:P-loop NTPase [Spirochaetaceae bacterium]